VKIQISNWADYNPRKDLKAVPWIRLENDIRESRKLFGLGPDQKWLWVFLLALAAKQNEDGVVETDAEYLAYYSGVDAARVDAALEHFRRKGLIVDLDEVARKSDESDRDLNDGGRDPDGSDRIPDGSDRGANGSDREARKAVPNGTERKRNKTTPPKAPPRISARESAKARWQEAKRLADVAVGLVRRGVEEPEGRGELGRALGAS
jgi:hypothetical protein